MLHHWHHFLQENSPMIVVIKISIYVHVPIVRASTPAGSVVVPSQSTLKLGRSTNACKTDHGHGRAQPAQLRTKVSSANQEARKGDDLLEEL
jgi:hypothetical protein